MEKRHFIFNYGYSKIEQLEESLKKLATEAKRVTEKAYAPYSNFHVGAAVLFEDGTIVTSTNQESEVFPSGICAERSLLYYVQANYPEQKIVALAVASNPSPRECYPCGACRQVICDTEKRNGAPIKIVMVGTDTAVVLEKATDLLPFTFQLN